MSNYDNDSDKITDLLNDKERLYLHIQSLEEKLKSQRKRFRKELLQSLPMECLTSEDPYYRGWTAAAKLSRSMLDIIIPEER